MRRKTLDTIAAWYGKTPWTRFINSVPWIGESVHEYLMARADGSATLSAVFRQVFGLKRGTLWIVCSELRRPTRRQRPEPQEHIYLGKYGDLDAFLQAMLAVTRHFPGLDVRFCTGPEFISSPGSHARDNLLLIGGPDYNPVVASMMQHTPYSYAASGDDTVLVDGTTGTTYSSNGPLPGSNRAIDYGVFLKMPNPQNPAATVIMLHGIHTTGVLGAARALFAADKDETSTVLENCQAVLDTLGSNPNFGVVVEVESVGFLTSTPRIDPNRIVGIGRADQASDRDI